MVTTATKTCAYWSCKQQVEGSNYLCLEHYRASQNGTVDRCPKCGRFKDAKFELCPDCCELMPVVLRLAESNRDYPLDASAAAEGTTRTWRNPDETAEHFFAYVLQLDGGSFYAGYTRDLRERAWEHRDGKTVSTAGRNPKLRYFEIFRTKREAKAREIELQKLARRNPRKLRGMINTFHDWLRAVDMDR